MKIIRTSKTNTICEEDGECRDEGMLVGLDEYIKNIKVEDILIVLHQMEIMDLLIIKDIQKSLKNSHLFVNQIN